MTTSTEINVYFDGDAEEFTASIGFCDPLPNHHIHEPIEGTGKLLSDALHSLADAVEREYEGLG